MSRSPLLVHDESSAAPGDPSFVDGRAWPVVRVGDDPIATSHKAVSGECKTRRLSPAQFRLVQVSSCDGDVFQGDGDFLDCCLVVDGGYRRPVRIRDADLIGKQRTAICDAEHASPRKPLN
jgi:hypothetical protein